MYSDDNILKMYNNTKHISSKMASSKFIETGLLFSNIAISSISIYTET